MITVERARELLEYDPVTGIMRRRITCGSRGKAGTVVGSPGTKGYLTVRLDGQLYLVHRLAWLIVKGEWPPAQIDHENTIKSDNRFTNLRPATNQQNHGNVPLYANNTSGIKGVGWDKKRKAWAAYITIDCKKKNLGRFKEKTAAADAYRTASIAHFGEFARAA